MSAQGFPLEGPYHYKKEAELAQRVADALRDAGWIVKRFSAHRSLPQQMADWPDIFALRADEVLLLECKAMDGRLSEGQQAFREAVWPHCGLHVHYDVIFDLRQLEPRWLRPPRRES